MKTVFINGSPKKKLSVSSYLLGVVRFLVGAKWCQSRCVIQETMNVY